MKLFFMIFFTLAGLFILLQTYLVMSSNKSEAQPYSVLHTESEFEIRFYPTVTMAVIKSSARSYKELGNSGFRKLANYIFGGSADSQKIAMTTPVHMQVSDSASYMSFVMPSHFNASNLPRPNDAEVNITASTPEYIAAIRFGGFASDTDIRLHKKALEEALQSAGIAYYGDFRMLAYNPPYQIFGRRNEVVVNVEWPASASRPN